MGSATSKQRLRNTSVPLPEQNGVSLLKPKVKVRFIGPGEQLRERNAGESTRTWTKLPTVLLLSIQFTNARNVALVYNSWSLFVRCAEPERPREAEPSRPQLLWAVGQVIESGRRYSLNPSMP